MGEWLLGSISASRFGCGVKIFESNTIGLRADRGITIII